MAIAIPEIIVLMKYNKLPTRDVKYSRENVFHRDHYTCQYCGNVFHVKELTVDHILPRDLGGRTLWNNITTACKPCNNKKANKTPEKAGMVLLHKPTKPQWLNPITNARGKTSICKSWLRFMDRVDDKIDESEEENKG
jgi:5-methylcytosine-specific restriction endonuclease McrA